MHAPINSDETKTMTAEKTQETPITTSIKRDAVYEEGQFVYLRGLITADGSNSEEAIQRIVGRNSEAFVIMKRI